jgi:hypothetical protein
MLKNAFFAAAVVGLLGGCATTIDQPGPSAARHEHFRDAKQGYAVPAVADSGGTRKLLHDHREMK